MPRAQADGTHVSEAEAEVAAEVATDAKVTFPKITAAQMIAAALGSTFPVLTLLGVDLSAPEREAIEELKWIAIGLFGADALIRVGRNVGNKVPKG